MVGIVQKTYFVHTYVGDIQKPTVCLWCIYFIIKVQYSFHDLSCWILQAWSITSKSKQYNFILMLRFTCNCNMNITQDLGLFDSFSQQYYSASDFKFNMYGHAWTHNFRFLMLHRGSGNSSESNAPPLSNHY